MFENISRNKKSIIYSWLISYTTFLLLFVTVSMLIYVKNEKIISDEINKSNEILLKKIRNNMDSVISDARNLGVEMIYNSRVQSIINYRGKLDGDKYYSLFSIQEDLKAYKASNKLIDNIFIVFKKFDQAVSSQGGSDVYTFYRAYVNSSGSNYSNWLKEFDERTSEKYFINPSNNTSNPAGTINYVRSISVNDPLDLSTSMVITINNKNFISDALDMKELNGSTLLIMDSKNNIISSTGPLASYVNLDYNKLSDSPGIMRTKLTSKKVVISYIPSSVNDWKYISVIPEEVYSEKLEYMRFFTFAGIISGVLLGVVLIYFFMKKNYNPVSELLKLLKDENLNNSEKSINEYHMIKNIINRTLFEKREVDAQLNLQKKALKENFLEKLLKGRETLPLPIGEALETFDFRFTSDNFVVVSFFLEEVENNLSIKDYIKTNDVSDIYFILANVFEEIISEHHKGFMVDTDGVFCCLVNISENRIDLYKEDLLKSIEETRRFLNDRFSIDFTISISSIHKNLAEVPTAYNESMETMKYKKVLGIEETLFYDEAIEKTQGTYFYPISKENQLINFMKAGDYEDSKTIMEEIFKKNFEDNLLSLDLAQCLMLNLVATMIRTVNEMSGSSGDNFLKESNPINFLLPCKTVDEMKSQLDTFLRNFCEHIAKIKDSNQSWIITKVVPYIQEHYNNSNLNVAEVAEHFDNHSVYLSRLFKEQVGEGILDYLNRIRVEKSKLLLKEKKWTLEEIASNVGFTNVHTLIRIFKKYEGITPGKFKDVT